MAEQRTNKPLFWEEGTSEIKAIWYGDKAVTIATVQRPEWHEDAVCAGREAGANAAYFVEAWNNYASQASRIEVLTEVAAPFAKYGQILLGQKVRDDAVMVELFDTKITVGDFRKLASAIALGEQSNG